MSKRTVTERLRAGLLARGYQPSTVVKSRKYEGFTKPGDPHNLYLGKAGALRRGDSIAASVPTVLREHILREVPE